MKLNNRFIFGILSLVLAAVIAFVALPTIARQTNGKTEIVRHHPAGAEGRKDHQRQCRSRRSGRVQSPVQCGPQHGGCGGPVCNSRPGRRRLYPHQQGQHRTCFLGCGAQRYSLRQGRHLADCKNAGLRPVGISCSRATSSAFITSWRRRKRCRNCSFVKVLSVTDSDGINVDNTKEPTEDRRAAAVCHHHCAGKPGAAVSLPRWKMTGVPMWR